MPCARTILAVLLAVVSLWASGSAANPPVVDTRVQQAMQARDYAGAVATIEEALKQEGTPKDYLSYLKGRSLALAKKYDEAAAVLLSIGEKTPASPWARKGRFAAAAAFVAKGDFTKAEALYRAEAESLLSNERKKQMAQIYLEFAEPLFDPPKESDKPDYVKAQELYERALDAGLLPEKRLEVELRIARCQVEQGGNALDQGIDAYKSFLHSHPDSAHDIEARFRLGEAYLTSEKRAEARQVWRELLAQHAEADSPRIAEAAFRLAETWRIPKPESKRELEQGTAALRQFTERYPDHELAAKAWLQMAESYMHRQDHEAAVEVLMSLLAQPRYEKAEELAPARSLLGHAYHKQRKYDEAIAAWQEFLARHPADPAWSDVQKAIVDTQYSRAIEAYEAESYEQAAAWWNEFLAQHPLDQRNPQILFLLGAIDAKAEQWEAAIATWRRLVSKYPNDAEAQHARLAIAATLEEKLGRLEDALAEYRTLAESHAYQPVGLQAQGAVVRMTSPSLTLATQRVFRSTEKPKVRISTRNIKAVSVRVYRLDLEAYFRKMHTTDDVGSLDIALIDPDATFTYEAPDYEKYRLFESDVEVPLPEGQTAGVLAITVSSKTQQATTLVLQSDLDVIVKSSRDQVFVFAQNMITGKPWPGARLLLSDGTAVCMEAVTNEQGLFQGTFDKLKEADTLQVLAAGDANMAAYGLAIEDIQPVASPDDKGYLATDRPIYRPGQVVRVRGILRHMKDGALQFEPGKSYTFAVYDCNDRRLWQESVVLGDWGSFHTQFSLPEVCEPGKYTLCAEDAQGRRFSRSITVEAMEEKPVRLEIDLPQTVFYRGDVIEGEMRAVTSYGVPLAGREIRYQLADQLEQTATTDQHGEIHFQLPTQEFYEPQVLPLSAHVVDGPHAEAILRLVVDGFRIDLHTARSVYMADEAFPVHVEMRDAHARPVAGKLVLSAFKQGAEKTETEELVAKHELESNAAGKAEQVLTLEAGGDYLLRVEATDRFGNTIDAERSLWISDHNDETRLRILADATECKSGDTLAVTVLWHEAPAPALLTCEGATVLQSQPIQLQTGANRIEIPISANLAPNFRLAVAVMTDAHLPAVHADGQAAGEDAASVEEQAANTNGAEETSNKAQFYSASESFTVRRELDVRLAIARAGGVKGPYRPGETLNVTVTTTDAQGNPLPAEIGLALVDARFQTEVGIGRPAPQAVFREAPRRLTMQTGSSIVFGYRPETTGAGSSGEGDDSQIEEEPIPENALHWNNARAAAPKGLDSILDTRAGQPEQMGGGFFQFGGGMHKVDPFGTNRAGNTASVQSNQETDRFGGEQQAENVQIFEPETPKTPTAEIKFAHTGFWNPVVHTGDDGKATVAITLPSQQAAWRLLAEGVANGTLAGQAEANVTVEQDLFVEMRVPKAFAEGDVARIPVAIHNNVLAQGAIGLKWKATILGHTTEGQRNVEVEAKGAVTVYLPVTLAIPEHLTVAPPQFDVVLELTVTAGDRTEIVRQTAPVLPLGVPVHGTAGGIVTGPKGIQLGHPAETVANRRSMQILISPTIHRVLLDTVLRPSASEPLAMAYPSQQSYLETATSDLMAAVALREATAPDTASADAEALDRRIALTIAQLVASQDPTGVWTWTGYGNSADLRSTARATWALALAKAADYPVPDATMTAAREALRNGISEAEDGDYESKVILLHAMTAAGEGNFPLVNRLYRDRDQLSSIALAYLALTLAEMDRREPAAEVLQLLAEKKPDQDTDPATGSVQRSHSTVELQAVRLLALQKVEPDSPHVKTVAEWLLAQRASARWKFGGAMGPAIVALADWNAKRNEPLKPYPLAVSVNGKELKRFEVKPGGATQVVDVPGEMLAGDAPEIRFLTSAEASYVWLCQLGGYVPPGNPVAATGAKLLKKTCQPAPRTLEGRNLPRGFANLAGNYTAFTNPLSQLPVDGRAMVELRFRQLIPFDPTRRQLEYVVLIDPIPAGTRVIEDSIEGPVERYEITPSGIVFHVVNPERVGVIRYELVADIEGVYQAGPTLICHAHRAGGLLASGERAKLEILPRGAETADPYRFTPEELAELGRHHFRKGEYQKAERYLRELLDQWNVRAGGYHEAIRMLLDIYLENGPAAKVVDTFEIVRTKWPDTEITFEQLLKIGAAYENMGEMERAYLVYRATVEGNLTREGAVAGFLESEGELLRSIDWMERLLREYPPEDYVAAAGYSLAQHVQAKAAHAGDDPKLREAGVNGDDLSRRSIAMLEQFLTEYPEHDHADRAAFSIANTLLEMEKHKEAMAACSLYADRYPKSKLVDSYWYMLGYCQFALGQPDVAADLFRKVSQFQWTDPKTGRAEESTNKWRSVYLLGQIFHSQGRLDQAIEEYRRVEDRFVDARRSIAYFRRQQIALPELTTLKPGEATEVELTYRNVPSCDVKVYGIDLVKFGRSRRSLAGVQQVNLAGIRPRHEETVKLDDKLSASGRKHTLTLPLEETGAYLVVCRGGNEYSSGLVLVTPLETKVEHLEADAVARVMVRDSAADQVVRGALVNVIDSTTGLSITGKTDLRGVFVAEGVSGPPTVIVKDEPARYSLHQAPVTAMKGDGVPMAFVQVAPMPEGGNTRAGVPLGKDRGAQIRHALQAPIALEFIETPLQDVVDYLKHATKIEIQIDRKALDDVGIGTDTPITTTLKNVSLKSALRLLLRELALTYAIENEVLLITTPEEAENRLETRMYPVGDLVRFQNTKGEQWADFDSLIDLITSTVKPQTWDEVGGPGSISSMTVQGEDVIVLSQIGEVHEEIEQLISRLRQVAAQSKDGELPVRDPPHLQGGFGGLGGMGGGMGGFGGLGGMGGTLGGGMGGAFFGGPAPARDNSAPTPFAPAARGGKAELLRGLEESQRQFQGEEGDQLQEMYQKGKGFGGMGAGGIF